MDGSQFPVAINTLHIVKPRLDVYYPSVTGMKDTQAQQKMNTAIINLVNKLIVDQEYYKNPRTEINGSFEIKTNERGILSLSIINDAYSGGVHGFTIIKSLTFDIKTGRIYTLKDLFKPGSEYVKVLSGIVGGQIRDRGIYLLGQYNGIKPDQDFYISDKVLVLYYQLYELTSYAFGFPHFPIPIYQISSIINEQGPLKVLSY